MTENEKIELFDKWYDENYDEWAEGEEGIALREELEQAFKSGIAELEKENAELKEKLGNYQKGMFDEIEKRDINLTKAKELLKRYVKIYVNPYPEEEIELRNEAEQFLSEVEK